MAEAPGCRRQLWDLLIWLWVHSCAAANGALQIPTPRAWATLHGQPAAIFDTSLSTPTPQIPNLNQPWVPECTCGVAFVMSPACNGPVWTARWKHTCGYFCARLPFSLKSHSLCASVCLCLCVSRVSQGQGFVSQTHRWIAPLGITQECLIWCSAQMENSRSDSCLDLLFYKCPFA